MAQQDVWEKGRMNPVLGRAQPRTATVYHVKRVPISTQKIAHLLQNNKQQGRIYHQHDTSDVNMSIKNTLNSHYKHTVYETNTTQRLSSLKSSSKVPS
jgi:hypothetical protein